MLNTLRDFNLLVYKVRSLVTTLQLQEELINRGRKACQSLRQAEHNTDMCRQTRLLGVSSIALSLNIRIIAAQMIESYEEGSSLSGQPRFRFVIVRCIEV